MSSLDVVVVVPMLGRGHLVDGLAESLDESTDRARLLFVCTAGDEHVRETLNYDRLIVPPRTVGDYAHKVNTAIAASAEPLIFTGAIDIRFRPGWLEACERRLTDGIGVVGTNDLCNPRTFDGRHSTHSLVTREYVTKFGTIDQPGLLLHEGYWHEMCDDELVQTAKARKAYAHATDAHVEHMHWMNQQRPRDDVDADFERRMIYGRRLLTQRRRLWMSKER